MAMTPLLPPRPLGPDGAPRRVGVEIEFTGRGCRRTAELARDVFGGIIDERDPYRFKVCGGSLGDLTIELDMRAAHPGED